jgi:hypothetical protein
MDPLFHPEPLASESSNAPDARWRELALRIVDHTQGALENLRQVLEAGAPLSGREEMEDLSRASASLDVEAALFSRARVMEGVFDGVRMVASDGVLYEVPENYASKSKLVEGDLLKLTLRPDGSCVYKSIGPIGRRRVVGELACDEEGGYLVRLGTEYWRVLSASIRYFRGLPGERVAILVPKETPSTWGAVENIFKT